MATLTQERLKEILNYDPETGLLRWKIKPARRILAGSIAGGNCNGYWSIGIDGHRYLAHRLAWLYTYGTWPEYDIDHRNGVKDDNRLVNLRDVPRLVNVQNQRRPQGNNRCGVLGVQIHGKKWSSRIRTNAGRIHLGTFATPEDAHQAYLTAKRQYHQGNTL